MIAVDHLLSDGRGSQPVTVTVCRTCEAADPDFNRLRSAGGLPFYYGIHRGRRWRTLEELRNILDRIGGDVRAWPGAHLGALDATCQLCHVGIVAWRYFCRHCRRYEAIRPGHLCAQCGPAAWLAKLARRGAP